MFGLGFSEILFIAVLALILIGPEELPEVARTLGRFLNEIRRGSDSFRDEIRNSGRKLEEEVKLPQPEQLPLVMNNENLPKATSNSASEVPPSILVHPEMIPHKKDEPS